MSKWIVMAATCFAFSAAFAQDATDIVAADDVVAATEETTAASDEVSGAPSEEAMPVLNKCGCGKGK